MSRRGLKRLEATGGCGARIGDFRSVRREVGDVACGCDCVEIGGGGGDAEEGVRSGLQLKKMTTTGVPGVIANAR